MEVEAEGEVPVVVLTGSQLPQARTASEESVAVAVPEVREAVAEGLGPRAAAPSESSSPELLPWFPITR